MLGLRRHLVPTDSRCDAFSMTLILRRMSALALISELVPFLDASPKDLETQKSFSEREASMVS